jgi:hypothetical protein
MTDIRDTLRSMIEAYVADDGTDDMDAFLDRYTALLESPTAGALPPPSAVNPDSSQPSVFRVLDLSTRHLPFEVCQDLNGFPGVLADERSEYGWFVWVPEDIDQHVAEIDAEDCQYVLFDRDAKVNPDLPTWEW